jgi:hypothetical protein
VLRKSPGAASEYNDGGQNLFAELITFGWLEGADQHVRVIVNEKRRAKAIEDMA